MALKDSVLIQTIWYYFGRKFWSGYKTFSYWKQTRKHCNCLRYTLL